MPITSYDLNLPPGYEGQIATTEDHVIRSAVNLTPNVIPWGRVVVRAADTGTGLYNDLPPAQLPSAAGQRVLGVNIKTDIYEKEFTASGEAGIPKNRPVAYMVRGTFYGYVEKAVAAGDPVFFRHTASGANTEIGRFRNDADTATAEQLPGAIFENSTSGPALVVIALNMV
jgi:hypothetical protein